MRDREVFQIMSQSERAAEALLYFDDVPVGLRFTTGHHTVTAEQIRSFAEQFDPQPFHLDAEAARASVFGALIASGWHTAAITMRLTLDAGPRFAHGTVGMGAELSWLKPVCAEDTLHAIGEVTEKTPSRKPDRGRVLMRVETRNQRGEIVQVQIARVLVPRKAQAAS
jgi:acyl dehydratase